MKSEKTVIIDMKKFGITTFVSVKQSKIDWYMNEYATQPDAKFGGGVGKKILVANIYDQILHEEKYFNNSVSLSASHAYDRWQYFLDGCVIYATLNSHFSGNPVPLVSDKQLADATLVSATKLNDAPDDL